jgi:hypothetical protein
VQERKFAYKMGKQARFPGDYPVSARNRLIGRPVFFRYFSSN